MDNATLKDIFGLEEIDFELLADAYNKLPDPVKHYNSGMPHVIAVPVYSPSDDDPPMTDDMVLINAITVKIFRFILAKNKWGKKYWAPMKKVYMKTS